jgi:DNA-binding NarL/FixJ family response regulator
MSRKPIAAPSTGNEEKKLEMSPQERKACRVLVIEPDQEVRSNFRGMLRDMGCGEVASAADHMTGLTSFQDNYFTHIIFDARPTEMPPQEFLIKVLNLDDRVVAIPSSFDPTVDDVFTLLIEGACGFVVKPATLQSLEEAVLLATKGDPISDSLLHAKDRNQALASFAMTALDNAALLKRQASQFETAKRDLPKGMLLLKRAVDMGKTFAKGGEEGIREAFIEFALDRASGKASKLGRSREKRRKIREATIDKRKESPTSTENLQAEESA